jgi:hypothetical protein
MGGSGEARVTIDRIGADQDHDGCIAFEQAHREKR